MLNYLEDLINNRYDNLQATIDTELIKLEVKDVENKKLNTLEALLFKGVKEIALEQTKKVFFAFQCDDSTVNGELYRKIASLILHYSRLSFNRTGKANFQNYKGFTSLKLFVEIINENNKIHIVIYDTASKKLDTEDVEEIVKAGEWSSLDWSFRTSPKHCTSVFTFYPTREPSWNSI